MGALHDARNKQVPLNPLRARKTAVGQAANPIIRQQSVAQQAQAKQTRHFQGSPRFLPLSLSPLSQSPLPLPLLPPPVLLPALLSPLLPLLALPSSPAPYPQLPCPPLPQPLPLPPLPRPPSPSPPSPSLPSPSPCLLPLPTGEVQGGSQGCSCNCLTDTSLHLKTYQN